MNLCGIVFFFADKEAKLGGGLILVQNELWLFSSSFWSVGLLVRVDKE